MCVLHIFSHAEHRHLKQPFTNTLHHLGDFFHQTSYQSFLAGPQLRDFCPPDSMPPLVKILNSPLRILWCIGVKDRGGGTWPPPKKKMRKNIFGQLLCNVLALFGQNHMKFGKFVNFSYIFFGQKCRAPLKLTEILRLYDYDVVQLVRCVITVNWRRREVHSRSGREIPRRLQIRHSSGELQIRWWSAGHVQHDQRDRRFRYSRLICQHDSTPNC